MIPLFITSSFELLFNKNTKAWWIGIIIVSVLSAIITFVAWLIIIGSGWYLLWALVPILFMLLVMS